MYKNRFDASSQKNGIILTACWEQYRQMTSSLPNSSINSP